MAARPGEAFGRFYRENLHALRGYIARLLPHSSDADDLANEAFTNVLAASTPERPVPPRAYLFAAAHNLVINHHRRHRYRGDPVDPDTANDMVDPAPAVDRELMGRERVDLLWEAVSQLPPRCQQVFLMRKVEHISNPEIAERLGISVSAVEKHIRYGLIACRKYLASCDGEDAPGDVGVGVNQGRAGND